MLLWLFAAVLADSKNLNLCAFYFSNAPKMKRNVFPCQMRAYREYLCELDTRKFIRCTNTVYAADRVDILSVLVRVTMFFVLRRLDPQILYFKSPTSFLYKNDGRTTGHLSRKRLFSRNCRVFNSLKFPFPLNLFPF